MSVWTEDDRVYSDAPDVHSATSEIERYAGGHRLELSREPLAKSELRGGRHVFLKHVLANDLGRLNLDGSMARASGS